MEQLVTLLPLVQGCPDAPLGPPVLLALKDCLGTPGANGGPSAPLLMMPLALIVTLKPVVPGYPMVSFVPWVPMVTGCVHCWTGTTA